MEPIDAKMMTITAINLGGPAIRVQISLSKHRVELCSLQNSRVPGPYVGRGTELTARDSASYILVQIYRSNTMESDIY